MTSRRFQLNRLISNCLFYCNIIIVLFAALLVLANAVIFNQAATYRFVLLPDSAMGLLAAIAVLTGAATNKRYLIVSGMLAVTILVGAGLVWHLPDAFIDNIGWLSGQNRLPLWQSIALILLCLPWLGWSNRHIVSNVSIALLVRLLANLALLGLCVTVLINQTLLVTDLFYSPSLSAATYTALYLMMLAVASFCIPYVKWPSVNTFLPKNGWLLVCFIALSSTLLWFNYAHQLQSRISQSAAELAGRLQHSLDQIVVEQRALMYRQAERIAVADSALTDTYLNVEFQSYLRDYPYIDYLAVAGDDGSIQYAKAQRQDDLPWFNQYLARQNILRKSAETAGFSEPQLTLHYDGLVDHVFICIRLPTGNDAGVRQLVASVDTASTLKKILADIVPPGYFVRLVQPEQQMTIYDSATNVADITAIDFFDINFMTELNWQLRVFTNLKTGLTSTLVAAEVILIAGWFTTLLVMLSQKLYQQSQRHRIRLLATNDKLRHNITELKRLQLQQQQIMSNSADMICVIDAKGHFIKVSASCQHILGFGPDELTGKAFIDFVHPDDRKMTEAEAAQIVVSGKLTANFRNRYLHKDGRTVHIMWVANFVRSEGLLYAIGRNFNDIVKAEQQLRLFKRAVDAMSNGIVIADLHQDDQPVMYVNPAFEKLTGYTADEIIGQNCRMLQGAEPDNTANSLIRRAIAERQECSVVLKNYRKDNSLFWNKLFLAPVPDESGEISHYVGVQTDITAHKRFEQELAYNASHDLLTALPNRALLKDRLHQSYQQVLRRQQKIAILFIDLDGFKLINDSLGHLTGDEVLKQMARRIASCIRPGDTLARIGGDEFVLLLTELDDLPEVESVAERILEIVASPLKLGAQELHMSASIGVSIPDDNLAEPMQLVQQADLAMYRAKQQGRNNYQWYNSELENASGKQLNLRAQLRKAIANNEFELYYQPQIDAISGDVVGLEALLRWPHPTLGFVSPDEFIPLAENIGEIVPLSNWVLQHASQYNQSLIERGIACVVMAVNVSSIQFARANFVAHLKDTITQSGLDARWFEIELTESLLFDNTEQVILKLQQLRELGVKISIDDFGTGYSSLSYLKRLPIDKLKIDRSFIQDIVSDKRDAAISKAIISLAHHLNIKVIAEGVENQAQAAILRKSLCDEYQGFYFAKPMPAAKLEHYLQNYQQNRLIRPEVIDGTKTILLVDDEENILSALTRSLRREGYHILSCTSAMQAFEVLALNQVQVIISDQRMPGMSGTEFLSQVKDMYPDTIRIVLSGYTDLKSVTEAINKGAIYKFMTKPWHDDELRQEIKKAFAQYQQQLSTRMGEL